MKQAINNVSKHLNDEYKTDISLFDLFRYTYLSGGMCLLHCEGHQHVTNLCDQCFVVSKFSVFKIVPIVSLLVLFVEALFLSYINCLSWPFNSTKNR